MLELDKLTNEEINVLVAEKVMEWKRETYAGVPDLPMEHDWVTHEGIATYGVGEWEPISDMAAAWEVIEKMRERDILIDVSTYPKHFQATPYNVNGEFLAHAIYADESAPKAICLAALAALEVTE